MDQPFPPATAPQPLAADEIHLWFCEFSASTGTRVQAQRLLLHLLSAYCGRPVGSADLDTGEHGKPRLAGGPGFNLSHSGDAAVVALAPGLELGVDLERPGRRRRHAELARRFFCPREADAVAAAEGAAREALFLHLWTAKEAVLKALGRGLAFGLERLEFAAGVPAQLLHIAADGGEAQHWQVHALSAAAPWNGHVAWYGQARTLRRFRLPPQVLAQA
ncbi:4'-phosphopantetheinyl transferase family protein [Tahibacter harae]|uniref:4'-phosphopantetheinyl transferase superfamily protein n=1 Tax=Tahibacter harae TaxID=2963937 RepID=A0ABT1QXN2_9GAMM|nr:4'-phosphopantetheinyl transferase superfamily protein [Tahibacter harae]MCQ4167044.1 4'-phosphopantetheinyl transferase superfamily protein [Tahibacter harae]